MCELDRISFSRSRALGKCQFSKLLDLATACETLGNRFACVCSTASLQQYYLKEVNREVGPSWDLSVNAACKTSDL